MFSQISLLVKVACIATCLAMQSSTQPSSAVNIPLVDLDNHEIHPAQLADNQKAAVIIFVATDCPISNSYAPTFSELWKTYHDHGINFFAIYSDPSTTAAIARQHCTDYKIPFTALLDTDQKLMTALAAKVTPETFVIAADGKILYHGRIDDRYAALGKPRYTATQHELVDALSSILNDKPIAVESAPAVGCTIAQKAGESH